MGPNAGLFRARFIVPVESYTANCASPIRVNGASTRTYLTSPTPFAVGNEVITVGWTVGLVGDEVGRSVGMLGAAVGIVEGVAVGASDGLVGAVVGGSEGVTLGTVGMTDGAVDGADGVDDGDAVGDVGIDEGLGEGCVVGPLVGSYTQIAPTRAPNVRGEQLNSKLWATKMRTQPSVDAVAEYVSTLVPTKVFPKL